MSETTQQNQNQNQEQQQQQPMLQNSEFESWLKSSEDKPWIKMESGEKRILTFDINKVEQVETKFKNSSGNPILHYRWTVVTPQGHTKTLELSKTASRDLYNMLKRNIRTLEVERQGISTDTKYLFFPIR